MVRSAVPYGCGEWGGPSSWNITSSSRFEEHEWLISSPSLPLLRAFTSTQVAHSREALKFVKPSKAPLFNSMGYIVLHLKRLSMNVMKYLNLSCDFTWKLPKSLCIICPPLCWLIHGSLLKEIQDIFDTPHVGNHCTSISSYIVLVRSKDWRKFYKASRPILRGKQCPEKSKDMRVEKDDLTCLDR